MGIRLGILSDNAESHPPYFTLPEELIYRVGIHAAVKLAVLLYIEYLPKGRKDAVKGGVPRARSLER